MESTEEIAPLTVKHHTSRASHKLTSTPPPISLLPYPQIPSRRSSISASARYASSSSGLATSTRTPSLDDSLYNIQVAKLRQDHATSKRDTHKTGVDTSETPFQEHQFRRCAVPRGLMTRSGYQLAPQLLVRWSSGSYSSLEQCLPSGSQSTSSGRTGELPRSIPHQDNTTHSITHLNLHSDSELMSPLELPIAVASIKSYTAKACVGPDYSISVWTSVNITVDVNTLPLPENPRLAPLDVVVVLDTLPHPSVQLLTPMVLACSVLTSNLVLNHDKLAIACVDGSTRRGFELLLSLGFHSFESTRAALDTFSLRQLQKRRKQVPDLSHSMQQVSQLFRLSPRAAFRHLVFISPSPPTEPLVISGIDPAIGFNTISPQPIFPLETRDHPLGWHIFYDSSSGDPRVGDSHFMRRVYKVIRQLRTGIRTGHISNLDLYINLDPDCTFLSAVECCQLKRLRPGESWILKTKIGVPSECYQENLLTENPLMYDLINQINDIIRLYSFGPPVQALFDARLKYGHSMLLGPNDIFLESHCSIARTDAPPYYCSDDTSSGLSGYEQGDEIISSSQGSVSELY